MATIKQILVRRWPGMWWTLDGDDYATLVWFDSHNSPTLKPTEAEIRAWSESVDAEIALEERAQRQQDALNGDSVDAILTALERIIKGEAEIKRKIDNLIVELKDTSFVGNVKTNLSPWNSSIVANIQAVLNRIDDIRLIT